MRIAVDATCWQNNRGYGRHARALLTALVRRYPEHSYRFFLDSPHMFDSLPPGAAVTLLQASAPTSVAAAANGHRSLGDLWRVSRSLSAACADVLLFPTVYSYVPVWTRAKKLVFIHDVIAETFPQLTLPAARARWFWKCKVALGRRQADAIVTVSEYSKRLLVERFGLDAGQVHVVSEASDPVFRPLHNPTLPAALRAAGLSPAQRLVVYVGGFSPHKNLLELVDAFARLHADPQFADARLVMVGEFQKEVFHSYFAAVRAHVEALGLAAKVVFAGYLPDQDLAALLNLACALVLPSLMEGFGLPAIEAAACGCPVIATTASPLPELLGAGGVYIEPGRGQIEPALRQVLESPQRRAHMRQAALAAAQRLSWEAAADQLMQVMRTLAP